MKDTSLVFEYTDSNNKQVKLSQNSRSGGIMVSEKDSNNEYHMVFSSFSSRKRFDKEGLINWYETEYQKIKQLFEDSFDDYCTVKGVKTNA